tara:strand:+ start:9752 stop:13900 length:4149 start_codon:yes stop_codon:yes gene_type:complete
MRVNDRFYIALILFLGLFTRFVNAQDIERISNMEGFNQNTISSIEQDIYGFLWFGTPNGLIKYDGYEFVTYTSQSNSDGNIISNHITSLYSNDDGVLWIGSDLGLNVYIPWLEKFYSVSLPKEVSINHIDVDPKGRIWFSGLKELYFCEFLDTEKGVIEVSKNVLSETVEVFEINDFSFKSKGELILATNLGLKKFEFKDSFFRENSNIPILTDYDTFKDQSINVILKSENVFWIGTNKSVLKVTLDAGKAHVINDFTTLINKKNNFFTGVHSILEDKSGVVWVATQTDGLYKYNEEEGTFDHFEHHPKNKLGLSSQHINALFQDNFNVLWIGTAQGGINKLDLMQKNFVTYSNNPYDDFSIADDLITAILEDSKGVVWMSGYKSSLFRSINPVNAKNIRNLKFENLKKRLPIKEDDIIRCIYEDRFGYIWFGSDAYMFVFNPKTEKFKNINLVHLGKEFKATTIRNIVQIDKKNLMLLGDKITILENPWKDIETQIIPRVNVKSFLDLKKERIQAFHINSNNSFWLGSTLGLLDVSYKSGKIKIENSYRADDSQAIKLSYKNVFSIHKEKNHLWLGTFGGGLNKITLSSKGKPLIIEYFRKRDVLPDDVIYGILQQENSHFWLSTDMGLVKFNLDNKAVNVYDVRDGLSQNNFRLGAYFKGKSGYFYFGGLHGLSVFNPKEVNENIQPPEILISELLINNRPVSIGEKINNKIILTKSISETSDIEIRQNQRIVSFNVAVKHTSQPSKNKLAYKLSGFNDEWTELNTGKSIITYTNLSAGNYVLRIKGANGDGFWSTKERKLNLKVLPPWYNTWWSYLFFFTIVLGVGIGIVIYFVQHERLKQGLIYEKRDKERIETINQGKFQYFTNLSHEFRTPLTLIAGPLERIIMSNPDPKNVKYLSIIQKNTKRLLNLVDQLITFRQAEQGRVNLNLVKLTLGDFIYPTTEAFENYAIEKNIDFFFKVHHPNEEIVIDIEKFERIIFNLLSNSFKNTPRLGTISIEASITNDLDEKWILIEVIDNGKGIPPENLNNIFERFYQLGNNEGEVSGGGIGLSFCKSIVNLFGGEIFATSTPKVETRFSVKIPSKNMHLLNVEEIKGTKKSYVKNWVPQTKTLDEKVLKANEKKEHSILIVEDEEDVQNFLLSEFSDDYNISIANNGLEALEMLKLKTRDLIISDVMMPEMDGYQLCEKIKSNSETCHVPLILLTALGDNDSLIKGLEFGADEYISKPFSLKYLQLRVHRLINNNIQIRTHFAKNSVLPKDEDEVKLEISKRDQDFIEGIIQVIEKNLSDSNFGVEELSREIGLSTSHFYRRLKQLTGQVPNVYLRNFRLQRAGELLESNEGFNVAEVMYQIGIESNSYFSTSFKKLHGVSPSGFVKRNS